MEWDHATNEVKDMHQSKMVCNGVVEGIFCGKCVCEREMLMLKNVEEN
jgi:hypothetical protein